MYYVACAKFTKDGRGKPDLFTQTTAQNGRWTLAVYRLSHEGLEITVLFEHSYHMWQPTDQRLSWDLHFLESSGVANNVSGAWKLYYHIELPPNVMAIHTVNTGGRILVGAVAHLDPSMPQTEVTKQCTEGDKYEQGRNHGFKVGGGVRAP